MKLAGVSEEQVRQARLKLGIRPVFKRVDTCAAEFEAQTPYLYSTYEVGFEEHVAAAAPAVEAAKGARRPRPRRRSSSWAAAPTASARASSSTTAACTPCMALREDGYETIMVNCNPETVSTDYDTSDRLYFEPLTREDVLEIIDAREARGRDRPVRRPDAAAPGGAAAERGREAARHQRRRHRSRRGPQALRRAAAQAGPARARLGHRPRPGRGARDRRAHRLSGHGAPVVRARRARDGDRPRPVGAGQLRADRDGGVAPREPELARGRRGRAHPDRPVPARRHRGRRRRRRRRHGRRHRRRHGAHRGGGHPLGRLGLLPAAVLAGAVDRRGHQGAGARAGHASSTCAA